MGEILKVAVHPAKPLLVYDGECNFCKFWALRWRRDTEERVDFKASQDPSVKTEYPEIPDERFDESIQFIETDGTVYEGAEAVCRSLTYSRWGGWIFWCYRHIPGVRQPSELLYRFVSSHRPAFSFLTRIFWGREAALPSYSFTCWVFLRLLGIVYLCAFVSLGTQIIGLAGHDGISPADEFMHSQRSYFDQTHVGVERYHQLPTLFWLDSSDSFLRIVVGAGVLFSALLIFNVTPAICLFLLWAIYLSLMCVSGVFLGFQWDALLLETGFLSIFMASPRVWSWPAAGKPPSVVVIWLQRWLLFRLMFESGAVKLLSGDRAWHEGTALTFHYQTQPLPTWVGWYAHQLPEGFQKVCVLVLFAIELFVPFLIFAPRRLRFVAFTPLVLLQVFILLTGNYCYFNLLTIALCILLLDDAVLARVLPPGLRKKLVPKQAVFLESLPPEREKTAPFEERPLQPIEVPPPRKLPIQRYTGGWRKLPIAVLAAVVLIVTVPQFLSMARDLIYSGETGRREEQSAFRVWPGLEEWLWPFRSINSYGLFAVMTTARREIIVEGSDDGQHWLAYEFRYKPGDPTRRPAFVAPHQPRLDWQMWFAALGSYRQNPWFIQFCVRLLEGSQPVANLLLRDPFTIAPPKYIRAELYEYRFTNFQERKATGAWWKREYIGHYLPPISLKR